MATAPSSNPSTVPSSPPQPRFLDYWLILVGVGVSAILADMTGLTVNLSEGTPSPGMQALLNALPTMLLLPVGVILFWPLFHALQWITGRPHGLAIGEWLLGLSWLGAVGLAAWGVGKGMGFLPDVLTEGDAKKYIILGYIIFVVSMGIFALSIWVIDLFGRWRQPWTHTLSLALLMWPAVPLLIVWARNLKLE